MASFGAWRGGPGLVPLARTVLPPTAAGGPPLAAGQGLAPQVAPAFSKAKSRPPMPLPAAVVAAGDGGAGLPAGLTDPAEVAAALRSKLGGLFGADAQASAMAAAAPWHAAAAAAASSRASSGSVASGPAPWASLKTGASTAAPANDLAEALRRQLSDRPELMQALGQAFQSTPAAPSEAAGVATAAPEESQERPSAREAESSAVAASEAQTEARADEEKDRATSPSRAAGEDVAAKDGAALTDAGSSAAPLAETRDEDERSGGDQRGETESGGAGRPDETPDGEDDAGSDDGREEMPQASTAAPIAPIAPDAPTAPTLPVLSEAPAPGSDQQEQQRQHRGGPSDDRGTLSTPPPTVPVASRLTAPSVKAQPVLLPRRLQPEPHPDLQPQPQPLAPIATAPLAAPVAQQLVVTQPPQSAPVQAAKVPETKRSVFEGNPGSEELPPPEVHAAPSLYQYEIRPGDDVDTWFRNVRRRIYAELDEGCSLQVVQEPNPNPHARSTPMFIAAASPLPRPGETTSYRYVVHPGEDLSARLTGLQRRIEAEIGDGCSVEMVCA